MNDFFSGVSKGIKVHMFTLAVMGTGHHKDAIVTQFVEASQDRPVRPDEHLGPGVIIYCNPKPGNGAKE